MSHRMNMKVTCEKVYAMLEKSIDGSNLQFCWM